MRGKVNARKHAHREVAWLAWHVLAPHMGKKTPTVEKLLGEPPAPTRKLSPAEIKIRMDAMALAWSMRNRPPKRKVRKLPKGGQDPDSPPTVA